MLFGDVYRPEKEVRNVQWMSDRVNIIIIVATLIMGIACQAVVNPPGGVWQDESRIDSLTDPLRFAYYIGHMFGHHMTGDWKPYVSIHSSKDVNVTDMTNFIEDLGTLARNYSVNLLGWHYNGRGGIQEDSFRSSKQE